MTCSANYSTGRRNYTFNLVQLIDVLEAITPLIIRNQAETGIYGPHPNPDFERYLDLDARGFLRTFIIQTDSGHVIGYSIFFIDYEIFQKDMLSATQSMVFVDKGHRGVGLAFIRFCDDILKKQGIISVWRQASSKLDVGKIYEHLGYEFVEKSFMRRL